MSCIDPRTFYRSGNGFVSVTFDPVNPSPLYTLMARVSQLLYKGHQLNLPPRYTAQTVGQLCELTGKVNRPFNITAQNAWEVVQIAQEVLSHYRAHLTQLDSRILEELIKLIK